jgi:glycerophosphoryl diester phosphodiesterase
VTAPAARPLVIAHRGASAGRLDNSLEAFAAAIEAGADAIEFDVRRTRDGVLVAFHDPGVGGDPVAALTRAELAARTGHAPPLLEEILDLARGRIGLDVELKEAGYVDRVLDALDGAADPDRVLVTSFLDAVVAEVKALRPAVASGLLLGRAHPRPLVRTRVSELYPVARARRCRADHVLPEVRLARLGALARGAAAGLAPYVWTVNDDASLRRLLADPRVAGVITDVPERALALRDSPGARLAPGDAPR